MFSLIESPVFIVESTVVQHAVLRTTVWTLNGVINWLDLDVFFYVWVFLFELTKENVRTSFG